MTLSQINLLPLLYVVKYCIFFIGIIMPCIVHADVRMTEVAWMGVDGTNGQYGEWIELYNDGTTTINLTGWQIAKEGGAKPLFTLSKNIAGGTYLLVERTTASMSDPVPHIDDEAGSFSNNGLSNSGEFLVLNDATGTIMQSLDFHAEWPAGDTATKHTMQWDGSSWVTAPATPGAAFQGGATTPSLPHATSSSSTSDKKESSTQLPLIPKISPTIPHIEFSFPESVYAGVEHIYKAAPVLEYHFRPEEGVFVWNMGDGTMVKQDKQLPLHHIYRYPGIYTVSFSYRPTIDHHIPPIVLTDSQRVPVVVPTVTATAVENGAAIELKNTIDTPVDMSLWQIKTSAGTRTIPEMTIIAPHATITILATTLGFSRIDHPVLMTANNISLSSFAPSSPQYTEGSSVPIPRQSVFSRAAAPLDAPTVVASAFGVYSPNEDSIISLNTSDLKEEGDSTGSQKTKSHTKLIMLGGALLFVVGLSILLERVMARQE